MDDIPQYKISVVGHVKLMLPIVVKTYVNGDCKTCSQCKEMKELKYFCKATGGNYTKKCRTCISKNKEAGQEKNRLRLQKRREKKGLLKEISNDIRTTLENSLELLSRQVNGKAIGKDFFIVLYEMLGNGTLTEKENRIIKRFWSQFTYEQFLKSGYWEIIADEVKRRAGYKCSLCYSGGCLNAHHRTYKHHGLEHLYMEDLICLCKKCHEKFHLSEDGK